MALHLLQRRTRYSKRIPAGQGTLLGMPYSDHEDLIWCPRCQQHRPLSAFARGGAAGYCKTCINAYYRANYQGRSSRNRSLRKNYGIDHDDYDRLWAQQGGVCAACGEPETSLDPRTQQVKYLCVDHDHATGAVRGLLCGGCNVALGCLQDNPIRIQALRIYIEQFGEHDPPS